MDRFYREEEKMKTKKKENLVNKRVTYTLNIDGKFCIIENVPARVNVDTGEQFFSPNTVQQIQRTIWKQTEPKKMMKIPVYVYPEAIAA